MSYSNDVIQLTTWEMEMGLQIYKITGKDKPTFMYGLYQDIRRIWKRSRNSETDRLQIYSQDIEMEFGIDNLWNNGKNIFTKSGIYQHS